MNTGSIQVRLTLWYTAMVVIASIGLGAYTYISLEHRMFAEMQSMLARRVEHLREDVFPGLLTSTPENLAQRIEEIYSPEKNEHFIRISKADGTVLYVSGRPREQSFDPAQIPPQHYDQMAAQAAMHSRESQHVLLVGYLTNVDGADYIFEMGASVFPLTIALHKLIMTLLIGLPVVALIAAMGGVMLIRRALQPVEAMRATAEMISFSTLRQRLPVTATGDAIEHLSRTLNQMLNRLDQAYQQTSRFSADASHELRTPLTVMRSELETLLHGGLLPPAAQERVGSVLEETERLSHIVESLFSLARLDAGDAKAANEVFDLAALAQLTLEQMHLLAEDKNLSVAVEAPAPVFVAGDAGRMKQVIVNLLDNAIKYTMPGGTIALSVHATGDKARLAVRDNGIGIPADALPHIFERFYRADKVRSRDMQGAGLGLSIVCSICQAHGGDVVADSRENEGTVMTVTLPLARAG